MTGSAIGICALVGAGAFGDSTGGARLVPDAVAVPGAVAVEGGSLFSSITVPKETVPVSLGRILRGGAGDQGSGEMNAQVGRQSF